MSLREKLQRIENPGTSDKIQMRVNEFMDLTFCYLNREDESTQDETICSILNVLQENLEHGEKFCEYSYLFEKKSLKTLRHFYPKIYAQLKVMPKEELHLTHFLKTINFEDKRTFAQINSDTLFKDTDKPKINFIKRVSSIIPGLKRKQAQQIDIRKEHDEQSRKERYEQRDRVEELMKNEFGKIFRFHELHKNKSKKELINIITKEEKTDKQMRLYFNNLPIKKLFSILYSSQNNERIIEDLNRKKKKVLNVKMPRKRPALKKAHRVGSKISM